MNQWTVKQKLGALLVGVIMSFGALTGFLLNRQAATSAEIRNLYESDFLVGSVLGEVDGLLTRVDINILRMIAIGDPASIAKWKEQNLERFTKVDKAVSQLQASADASLHGQIKSLGEAYARLRKGMEHQVQAIESGDVKGAGEINKNEVKDNADATFSALTGLRSAQDQLTKHTVESQQASAAATRLWSIAVALLVAMASVGMGLLLVRNLLRQLGGEPSVAAQAVSTIAQGNLAAEIHLRDGDNTSLMATLKDMQSSLARVVGGVRQNAEGVATASAQIAQGNNDLSGRTEEQASALEETAASMEQLSSTVKQNADNARQANQLALGASTVAIKGGEVVSEVVTTMKGINDSSKKIADIISVIDGIAFQTNILALNAAVEAARAGEQGRGFAVVASEVRNLAGRSAEAAKEIKSLITASVERVEQGTALVDQAGVTMTEVVGAIKRVTDIMGEISAASSEQSAGVTQVGEAISQMDQVTQQNAALVEESAAAAESLTVQAQQLVQAVAVFKLNQGGADAAAAPMVHEAAASKTYSAVERRGPGRAKNVTRPAFGAKTKAADKTVATSSSSEAVPATTGTDNWESF